MTLINFEVLWSYLWRYAIIAAFFFGLGFMLGCGPEDRVVTVTTTQFVGKPQTEAIQTIGMDMCFRMDDPTAKRGAIAWGASNVSPDGTTGDIVPCNLANSVIFSCQTDASGYVVSDRPITKCMFSSHLFF